MRNLLVKVGNVLNLFSWQYPEWGVSEVAKKLDIPKSTTCEIMASLVQQGLLSHTPTGRYRLGWRLFELSQVLLDNTAFCIEARTAMQELVERWGETTHLAVLDGVQVLYVEKMQGTPAVQILLSRIGARLPAHCSSVGKVLLAHQQWQQVADGLAELIQTSFTPNTITSLDTLKTELEKIRQQGYAYDHEEVVPGLCCVAAPIYENTGNVIAAISLSTPAYRFYPQQEHYTEIIVKTADTISSRLMQYPQSGPRNAENSVRLPGSLHPQRVYPTNPKISSGFALGGYRKKEHDREQSKQRRDCNTAG